MVYFLPPAYFNSGVCFISHQSAKVNLIAYHFSKDVSLSK